jgi:hypothetical protein
MGKFSITAIQQPCIPIPISILWGTLPTDMQGQLLTPTTAEPPIITTESFLGAYISVETVLSG